MSVRSWLGRVCLSALIFVCVLNTTLIRAEPQELSPDVSRSPFLQALQENNLARLSELLGSESERESLIEGFQLLHHAVSYNNLAAIALLLKHGADIHTKNRRKQTALHRAAFLGHLEACALLLSRGADPNERDGGGNSAFDLALQGDDRLPLLRLLRSFGADVRAAGFEGRTPLHYAAEFRLADATRFLLAEGADIAATDHLGRTALHTAVEFASVGVAQTLLQSGASPNSRSHAGLTPLHVAAALNHATLTRRLLQHRADVTIADNHGWTPLHEASAWGSADVVRLLLEAGADRTRTTSLNETPIVLARRFRHDDCVAILEAGMK